MKRDPIAWLLDVLDGGLQRDGGIDYAWRGKSEAWWSGGKGPVDG
jgi:hypothetical protein